jgi:curved DNA-binding protein CbpA
MFNKVSINMSKFGAQSFSRFFPNTTSRNFAEKIKLRKDYYQILGIPKSSSEEEIKQAYRNLAKRFHPDVSVGADKYDTNVEKFRDIAEAYAVLSNKTLRLDYDMRMRNFPDIIYNAEKMKNMKESEVERDNTANKIKPAPLKGSYAEYRLEKLKEWRKEFNVDDLGNYKGGVPRKWNGPVRGRAEGAPGMHRSTWHHNEQVHDNPHARDQVTLKESDSHKIFMNCKKKFYKFSKF